MDGFDDGEDWYEDANYAYMEDTYMEADDLAQHAVASPPPFDEDADFDEELWRFEYWNDIDYDSDGNEVRTRRADIQDLKRRRSTQQPVRAVSPSKRRKIVPTLEKDAKKRQAERDLPAILLVKNRASSHIGTLGRHIDTKALKPYALLPDWSVKLKNAQVFSKKSTVKLAEVPDLIEDEEDILAEGEEGGSGWEDEEEEGAEGEEEGGDISAMLGGMDPEALKMALRQNLANIGINVNGMDEESLLRFASKMLSGEAEADDIAGELADELLQEGEEADEDGEEDAEGAPTFVSWATELAKTRASTRGEKDTTTSAESSWAPSKSPPDNKTNVAQPLTPTEGPLQDVGIRGTKRKLEGQADGNSTSKRLAPLPPASLIPVRRFGAPTAASKARVVAPAKVGRKRK
ncbi:hypothetical protein EG328_005688 [Venturia inaequalis]|uniref:Uncharacterized protein n=1 Tax=Venturia inaequalis TaxID=5025 RepID=A0A8H3VAS2_VENIN|nr:hypothetical protein EG328_005688 [Venturia inaequalis]KAE9994845.1 hypothetical protein EG327_000059 [Venturia inaequalis]